MLVFMNQTNQILKINHKNCTETNEKANQKWKLSINLNLVKKSGRNEHKKMGNKLNINKQMNWGFLFNYLVSSLVRNRKEIQALKNFYLRFRSMNILVGFLEIYSHSW